MQKLSLPGSPWFEFVTSLSISSEIHAIRHHAPRKRALKTYLARRRDFALCIDAYHGSVDQAKHLHRYDDDPYSYRLSVRHTPPFPCKTTTYLISASSRTPPNAIRWNFLLRAEAMDFPNVVFPTPGCGCIQNRTWIFVYYNHLRDQQSTWWVGLHPSWPWALIDIPRFFSSLAQCYIQLYLSKELLQQDWIPTRNDQHQVGPWHNSGLICFVAYLA